MRFIGDVHAKFDLYQKIALDSPSGKSIQVGDFGAGFAPMPELGDNHTFIRGNHDDPALCREHGSWIPDGTMKDDIFYCGGAYSIDVGYRTENLDWWKDEELSIYEGYNIYDQFVDGKYTPRIIVTHDMPEIIVLQLLKNITWLKSTRTGKLLEAIFEQYKPELWICGHWHQRAELTIMGTRFICLDMLRNNSTNEDAWIDIDL